MIWVDGTSLYVAVQIKISKANINLQYLQKSTIIPLLVTFFTKSYLKNTLYLYLYNYRVYFYKIFKLKTRELQDSYLKCKAFFLFIIYIRF